MYEINKDAEDIRKISRMKLNAQRFINMFEQHKKKAIAEDERCKAKLFASKNKGQWDLCKELGSKGASPMVAATRPQRGPEGQAKGTVATNPREVDSIVRGNLGKIYAGNVKNGRKMTQEYMEDYKKHIFIAKTSRAEKLTGADLHKAAADAGRLTLVPQKETGTHSPASDLPLRHQRAEWLGRLHPKSLFPCPTY